MIRRAFVFLTAVGLSAGSTASSCGGDGDDDAAGSGRAICARACEAPSDCADGSAADMSADNYACEDGFCAYLGCLSDAECLEAYPGKNVGCAAKNGISLVPMCTFKCDTVAGCAQYAAAYDDDNYACASGFCVYTGCNSDEECQQSAPSANYACRQAEGSTVKVCVPTCATAADCAEAAEGPSCVNSACVYAGCTSDDACAQEMDDEEYGCFEP
jgi:hypothetical protein